MNFNVYYDKNATDRAVLREVYKGLRPEVKGRGCRTMRHELYREVMYQRTKMAQLLGWYHKSN